MAGEGNTNPFTWIDLDFDSLYYLITNWENVKWNDYEINRVKHPYRNCHLFEIIIENKVHLRYVHYLFDKTAKKPRTVGQDVKYCKIWEYIVQKFEERTKRMLERNEKPIFITEWEHMNYDEAAFWKIEKENLKYKLVVITSNKNLKTDNKNILVIYDPAEKGPRGLMPIQFARKYSTVIFDFMRKNV